MDNKKLIAPRPVKVNPFLNRRLSKISFDEKRKVYRNSDRVKSEEILNFPCPFNTNLLDSESFERDFLEIDAKFEILSILNNDASFTSSYCYRDSEVSISTFDFNEQVDEHSHNNFKSYNFKSC